MGANLRALSEALGVDGIEAGRIVGIPHRSLDVVVDALPRYGLKFLDCYAPDFDEQSPLNPKEVYLSVDGHIIRTRPVEVGTIKGVRIEKPEAYKSLNGF